MSNRRSSTNLLHRHKRQRDCGVDFCIRSFSRKKLSKMVVERVRGRGTASSRAVRKRARRVRARPWRRRCVRGRQELRATQAARPPRSHETRSLRARRLARREIARRPEGTKLRVVQQRVAVRVLRRGRQGARGAGQPVAQVRVVLSRRAVRSSLTRRRVARRRRRCRSAGARGRHDRRAADLFERLARPDLRTRARRPPRRRPRRATRTPNATRA